MSQHTTSPALGLLIAYVGCRTTRERNARGNGIEVFRVLQGVVAWEHVQSIPVLPNPSFLALDRSGRFLLTVHGDASEVSSFSIDGATGCLTQIGTWSTQGKNPVHLTLDRNNRFLVVANHITSSLAVLPFDAAQGTLGEVRHLEPVRGTPGPHRVEQPFPKPHQVVFDPNGRFLSVPDKGVDRVFTYSLDAVSGRLGLAAQGTSVSREGAGPRHIAFHPEGHLAYVINELDSTITAYRYEAAGGRLDPFQTLSALPDTWVSDSRAAEIEVSPDGRFLYASNRGSDTIVSCVIDQVSGRLSDLSWASTGGRTPRFFALTQSGTCLYAANEDSDDITCFTVDPQSGQLGLVGRSASTGSPTCIAFRALQPA